MSESIKRFVTPTTVASFLVFLPFPERSRTMKPIKSPIVRAFMRFLVSHVGLCILVSAYYVLGALLFLHFESPLEMSKKRNENENRCSAESDRSQLIERIQLAFVDGTIQLKSIKEWLDEFHHNLTTENMLAAYHQTNDHCNSTVKYTWSVSSAILFTVTALATIGYGNIVPTTDATQFILICYSLFGIPLTLMFFNDIGRLCADVVRLIYNRGICHGYRKRRNQNHRLFVQQVVAFPIASVAPLSVESPMPTIPRGLDERDNETRVVVPYLGLKTIETVKPVKATDVNGAGFAEVRKSAVYYTDDYETDHREFVPKTFIFAILAFYTLTGTMLFAWSEHWTYVESGYFTVVTLLTIGLGDLVPGWTQSSTTWGQVNMCVGSLYIMLGLVLVFMGLNLIVDELLNASKKAAMKIGLVKEEEKKQIRSNVERAVRRQNFW